MTSFVCHKMKSMHASAKNSKQREYEKKNVWARIKHEEKKTPGMSQLHSPTKMN